MAILASCSERITERVRLGKNQRAANTGSWDGGWCGEVGEVGSLEDISESASRYCLFHIYPENQHKYISLIESYTTK